MQSFDYVGPEEIRAQAAGAAAGAAILSRADVLAWLRVHFAEDAGWATFVVDLSGTLLLAPRRTEHVACAAGRRVLAAGELCLSANGVVTEVTNNSTGYCPAEDCFPAVRRALERAAVTGPPSFTFLARFRRCPQCGARNLVKDEWFRCALCDSELPAAWNFDERESPPASGRPR